jgi:hypothetical protein
MQNNNHVQIVLNSTNYISSIEKPAGGGSTDFFLDRDADFVVHKQKIIKRLDDIKESISHSPNHAAFVKVRMRKEALAKSHRPTQQIFKPDIFPSAGAEGLGEIYVLATSKAIDIAIDKVEGAENTTRRKFNAKKEKEVPAPSRARSEVGAVESVELPSESDRRKFSIREGLEWLRQGSGKLYVLDLFNLPGSPGELKKMPREEQLLYESLIKNLNKLDFGIQLFRSSINDKTYRSYLLIRPVIEKNIVSELSLFQKWDSKMADQNFDDSESHHQQLISVLSDSVIIRRISLPPIIKSSHASRVIRPSRGHFPTKNPTTRYPKIGVIDSGVSNTMSRWLLGSYALVAAEHRQEDHGNFISGLLIAGRSAGNSSTVARERDGCEIYDIDILPDSGDPSVFDQYYPNGFEDFLSEMNSAILLAKSRHGVRVFNLSINIDRQVDEASYSEIANILDSIAESNDVIIVISAGNMSGERGAWPRVAADIASYLLPHAGSDRILQPAESAFCLSVGALTPPGMEGYVDGAPAPYTRCGPGMKVGIKPDFCHFGGATLVSPGLVDGLYSMNGDGQIETSMGTSFAAPLVAKTLATLDSIIEGPVTRENLIALMVHGSELPDCLKANELESIAKRFVGFGIPASSEEILIDDDYSITMVFNGNLTSGKALQFDFSWPAALVGDEGKCRGAARISLVYKPIIDSKYGAEFIRVNLDAYLRQNNNGTYKGRAEQVFTKQKRGDVHFESDLIEHGLKWWPMKHYNFSSEKGVGKSSEWRLVVEPLLRSGAQFPQGGVPFSVVLTIFDPKREETSIFSSMKQWLTANGVMCDDIRTALRSRLRN